MEDRLVTILWSGGWDSTFRVLQLVYQYKATVQPYYIVDHQRRSTRFELDAIDSIVKAVTNEDTERGNRLLPVKTIHRSDLIVNPSLENMWKRLRKRGPLGTQYVWLAAFVRQYAVWGLELTIHADDRATKFVRDHVVYLPDDCGGYYELSELLEEPDLELFRGFRFPILDRTKVQMKQEADRLGFGHLMNLTWFCHSPTKDGTPCGVCTPCRDARKEGMGWRVPPTPAYRWMAAAFRRNLGRVKNVCIRVLKMI